MRRLIQSQVIGVKLRNRGWHVPVRARRPLHRERNLTFRFELQIASGGDSTAPRKAFRGRWMLDEVYAQKFPRG